MNCKIFDSIEARTSEPPQRIQKIREDGERVRKKIEVKKYSSLFMKEDCNGI